MRELIFPYDNTIKCDCDETENDYFAMLFPIIQKAKDRGELKDDLIPLHVAGHFYSLFILLVSSWYSGRIESIDEISDGMYSLFKQTLEGLAPSKSI